MEFISELKIPKQRTAVLIGEKGSTKKKIEKVASTDIKVNDEGIVTVSSDDNFKIFITIPIIKAIARGFNPETAMELSDEKNHLEIIDISDFSGKSKKKMIRLKSRLIGTQGKAWKNLERVTSTKLAVYGKTVAIIGEVENVMIAKQSIEKLLSGSPHGNVYQYIERERKKHGI